MTADKTDRWRKLSVDFEEPAVGSRGMDGHYDFLRTSRTPADVGVAGLILTNPAINPAALEYDPKVVFITRVAVVGGLRFFHFNWSILTRVLMKTWSASTE